MNLAKCSTKFVDKCTALETTWPTLLCGLRGRECEQNEREGEEAHRTAWPIVAQGRTEGQHSRCDRVLDRVLGAGPLACARREGAELLPKGNP